MVGEVSFSSSPWVKDLLGGVGTASGAIGPLNILPKAETMGLAANAECRRVQPVLFPS